MNRSYLLFFLVVATALEGSVLAYYNVTAINTTLILNSSTGAKVIETYSLFIGNSSIGQYEASRGAYNLSLSDWQTLLNTPLLTEHVVNPRSGVTNFTFLPEALVLTPQGGASKLLLSYYVYNVTTVVEIAPRKFQYTFNDSVLNFEHTASGQELGPLQRFNIITPSGSQIVSAYPLPDSPTPNFAGSYTNDTLFSWYSQEPLNGFSFSYTAQQSLQQEVLNYFLGIYKGYSSLLYLLAVMLVGVFVAYVYLKFIAPE